MSKAAELQALLDSQPKIAGTALPSFSVEEADFDVGRVVLRFAAQPAFRNYHGHVQGGFAVAMVDVLMSVAAFARTRAWLPTVEIKSTFVAPLRLGESRGEASVIKAGKQLVFLEARLWGADGNLAVHATATASVPRHES
ncbi:MAG: PaaI family thioesterase [Rubrivivax sp.]|nr:PaaI family thioesterase [Rubrivivax sp.]